MRPASFRRRSIDRKATRWSSVSSSRCTIPGVMVVTIGGDHEKQTEQRVLERSDRDAAADGRANVQRRARSLSLSRRCRHADAASSAPTISAGTPSKAISSTLPESSNGTYERVGPRARSAYVADVVRRYLGKPGGRRPDRSTPQKEIVPVRSRRCVCVRGADVRAVAYGRARPPAAAVGSGAKRRERRRADDRSPAR